MMLKSHLNRQKRFLDPFVTTKPDLAWKRKATLKTSVALMRKASDEQLRSDESTGTAREKHRKHDAIKLQGPMRRLKQMRTIGQLEKSKRNMLQSGF